MPNKARGPAGAVRRPGLIAGLTEVPTPALILGLAGLAPFLLGAGAMALGSPTVVVNAYLHLLRYAAIILTYIGAVHWGLAVAAGETRWWWYAVSILPALVAWLVVSVAGPVFQFGVMAIAYFVVFMVDLRAVEAGLAPRWYANLRKFLTIAVLLCFGVVLWAVTRSASGA